MMNLQNNKIQTAFNLVTGLVTTVVAFAVSFFLSPFIVKHLGAEANGFSQLATNFVMYASLVTVAFNSMGARFVSVSYHQGEIEKSRGYYSTLCVLNVLMIALFLPLAIYVVWDLPNLIVIENAEVLDVKLLFACVFLNFFISLVVSLFTIAMVVTNSVYYRNLLNAISTILNAILLLVVFSVFPVKIFYISLVGASLSLVLLPIYMHLHHKLLPEIHFIRGYFSWKSVKDLFLSGIWNTVNQCGHMLNTGLDLLFANLFVNPFMMGVLAVSKTMPSAIIQLASTVNTNFAPSIIQTWAKADRGQILRELRVSMKISSVVVSIPIITFCCFGYEFYSLWQPTLDAQTLTYLSFLALLPFIPVAGTQTLYNVFTASNKLKVNSISFVINGILNVLIVYFCLKKWPQYGVFFIAGVSAILSLIRQFVVILPYVARILKLPWYAFFRDVFVTLICCAINIIAALPFLLMFKIPGWGGLIIMCVVTVLISLVADAYILLSKEEREKIVSALLFRQNK